MILRSRCTERGQAIVLIAIMLAIVVGMAALAIDGARAYSMRREMQAAVDAATLAAGDRLQQTGSFAGAEQAASDSFAMNLRLYSPPSCSPGYGPPGATPRTVTCNYGNGTVLTQVVSDLGPQGTRFSLTATRSLQLEFASIITNGTSPTISASSSAGVNDLRYTPTIAALDQAGCGGDPGNAMSINGSGTLTVIGDVVSSGSISVPSGGLTVAGDIYARCQPTVAGSVTNACYPTGGPTPCTYPDVAGAVRPGFHFADPNYPPPIVVGGSQAPPGADVVLSSGVYAADPSFSTSRCYFLRGGVYDWQHGYTNAGGFVSNELKPPDEPLTNNNTQLGHQMWNTGGANCAGAFQVGATGGAGIQEGTWGVEMTSAQTVSGGSLFNRESAPSMCRTVFVGDSQVIKVQISNVPGATSYNVYLDPPPSSCNGPFGFAGSVVVTGLVRNDNTGACPALPSTCSLGSETAFFDATVLGPPPFAPSSSAAPGVRGAHPPASETPPLRANLPNQNPDRATPPGGDRANENACQTIGGVPTACPGPVTPGAVAFYIPSGGCLNATTMGDNFLFSGYQYDWMMVYEPGAANPPANTCANMLGAAHDSAFIGLIYTPSASLNVQKAATFRTEATGGLIADTINFTGQLPTIIYSPSYSPVPPATKLTG